MPTSNTANLPVTQLDFNGIKSSLKDYLRGQTTFSDYDFEGSGLSVLLDLLAYNTHQIAFMMNMVARESFIDSASLRSSVVGLAKHLGYTPRSIAAATVILDIDFGEEQPIKTNDQPRAYVEIGDTFSTTVNSTGYVFTALENFPVSLDQTTGTYRATNVRLYEGTLKFATFVYDSSQTTTQAQRFELPSAGADTRTLKVRVQASKNDSTGIDDLWELSSNIVNVTADSKVYFIQENSAGKQEIYFGDNIAGKALENGNIVVIQYLETNGPDGNGIGRNDSESARTFTYELHPTADCEVTSPGSGGDTLESIESIKYYAPLSYQAQLRAVTAEDYRAIIAREYGNVESVMVWGGEDNDPPQYGKVFVSLKPISGVNITDSEKLAIKTTILSTKNIVSITPEIVDPDYLYLGFDTTVYYDPKKTVSNASFIETQVRNEILRFADEELDKFDRHFHYSKFAASIDNLLTAINSNSTELTLTKRFEPALGTSSSYKVDFQNAILHPQDGYPSVLSSTGFGYVDSDDGAEYDSYFDDDGEGNVRVYRIVDQEKKILNATVGTIDYDTGVVELTNFNTAYIVPPYVTDIGITVVPRYKDIQSKRNQILSIDQDTLDTAITVSAVIESVRQNPYTASGMPFPFDSV